MIKKILLSLAIFSLAYTQSAKAQDAFTIEGNIYDNKTKEIIPFVTIQIEGTNQGTVSNTEGHFKVRVPNAFRSASLIFYAIGYKRKSIKINEIRNLAKLEVILEQDLVQLEEVVVKPINPTQLLKDAIAKIPQNYAEKPINMKGFYRELVKENEQYVKLTEAACEFHYTPYTSKLNLDKAFKSYYNYSSPTAETFISGRWYDELTLADDQVKILEVRSSEDLSEGVLKPSISGGPVGLLAFDKVKYKTYFMSISKNNLPHASYKNYLKDYVYELENITTYNDREVYILTFKPEKADKTVAAFEGKMYIDRETLAFVAFEYRTTPTYQKIAYNLLRNTITHKTHTVRLDYRQLKGKWYIHQISVDDRVQISERRSKKIVGTYETESELLISSINNEGFVQKFKEDEIFKNTIANYIYDLPTNYEPTFWEKFFANSNFIPLEDKVRKDLEKNKTLEMQFLAKQSVDKDLKAPIAEVKTSSKTLHGDTQQDDYAWLMDKDNPKTLAYLKAENKYANNTLLPLRAKQKDLYNQMINKISQNYTSAPTKMGNHFYYTRYGVGQRYGILARKAKDLNDTEKVLLNINKVAEGHEHYEIDAIVPSPNERILAYMVDTTGNFHTTVYFTDLSNNKLMTDRLNRATSLVWAKDSKTVFYTIQDETNRSHEVYRHTLGTAQYQDKLVYKEMDLLFSLSLDQSSTGAYIFINADSPTASEVLYFKASDINAKPKAILAREKNHKYKVDASPEKFYILTNKNAPNFKLVSTDLNKPTLSKAREEVATSNQFFIENFKVFEDFIAVQGINQGKSQVSVKAKNAASLDRVKFDSEFFTASIQDNYDYKSDKLFIKYKSFTQPEVLYSYDFKTKELDILENTKLLKDFKASDYQFDQILAKATDGTQIPITLFYKKGLNLKAENPLFLTSSGLFGRTKTPDFDLARIKLVDLGFIYAVAHIRGGNEMGAKWHDEGRLYKKKNTFGDFTQVAQYLVDEKYTNSEKLVGFGERESAVTLGVALNEKPELFKVAVFDDAYLDVLNTMLDPKLPLTTAEYEEWGNPLRNKQAYEYIKSYSPYQNIKAQKYPDIFFLDYFQDEEIAYWQSAKAVAKLRKMQESDNLILLKTNLRDGHSGPSGRYQKQREEAWITAFILKEMAL